MGDLWGFLFQVGFSLFPLAGLVFLVVFVLWISRRLSSGGKVRETPSEEAASPAGRYAAEYLTPADRRVATVSSVTIAISGLCLPWVVGLSVKIYLDSIGEPTHPVSSFLEPVALVVLLGATVLQWCWPFLLLAACVRARIFTKFAPNRTFRERLLLVWMTHLAGLVGGVIVFVPVFRQWDIMYIFVPIACFLLVPMLAGYGLGRLTLRVRDRLRGPSPTVG